MSDRLASSLVRTAARVRGTARACLRVEGALSALSSGLPYRIYDCALTPELSGQDTNDARSQLGAIEVPATNIAHDVHDNQRGRLPSASLYRMTKKAPFRAPFAGLALF
ncbi:hypothetical protein [Bradyrhizobium sp. 2S1]|uniref:hypothetical protein n=1 Tax=Bradyrhizobium sp. 2S1 TaxID=1404429 RepID=UPI00140CC812|nr:hypothetical protein [Bradyrhizobium sp. 2S1]MCK7670011.1 hypothetical protein [Bradyrhizobium sp. 2S1]